MTGFLKLPPTNINSNIRHTINLEMLKYYYYNGANIVRFIMEGHGSTIDIQFLTREEAFEYYAKLNEYLTIQL